MSANVAGTSSLPLSAPHLPPERAEWLAGWAVLAIADLAHAEAQDALFREDEYVAASTLPLHLFAELADRGYIVSEEISHRLLALMGTPEEALTDEDRYHPERSVPISAIRALLIFSVGEDRLLLVAKRLLAAPLRAEWRAPLVRILAAHEDADTDLWSFLLAARGAWAETVADAVVRSPRARRDPRIGAALLALYGANAPDALLRDATSEAFRSWFLRVLPVSPARALHGVSVLAPEQREALRSSDLLPLIQHVDFEVRIRAMGLAVQLSHGDLTRWALDGAGRSGRG